MAKVGDSKRNYKILSKLGEGGYGMVYLVEDVKESGKRYAMKIVRNVIMNDEVKIGLTLSKTCPFLVKFKEIFMDAEEMTTVMEYCNGGDLSKRIKSGQPPSDIEIYRFLYTSAMALKTLHDAGIVHRDIKLSNFFIAGDVFKLGDYGMAMTYESSPAKTMSRVGTEGYTACEILRGESVYTKKIDIFSLGVSVLEFLIGYNPFSKNSGKTIDMLLAIQGRPADAILSHPLAHHPAFLLALRMIAENPEARPSADDILNAPINLAALRTVLRVDGGDSESMENSGLVNTAAGGVRSDDDGGEKIKRALDEAEKAKQEARKAKGEMEKAKQEAREAKGEIEKVKQEAQTLRKELEELVKIHPKATLATISSFVWSNVHKHKSIAIWNNGKTVENTDDCHYPLCLLNDQKITCGVATVSIKIIKMKSAYCYSELGILKDLPVTFLEGVGYGNEKKNGWGMHAFHELGIYNKAVRVADSKSGFKEGDTVTMEVDVGTGSLTFSVNGRECAQLKNITEIKTGVYLAGRIAAKGDKWAIVATKYHL